MRGIISLSVTVTVLYLTWRFGGIFAGKLAARKQGESAAAWWICIGSAALWPLVLIGFAAYGAMTYHPRDRWDPGDAPTYVFIGAAMFGGIMFVLGLIVSGIISRVTYRRLTKNHGQGSSENATP